MKKIGILFGMEETFPKAFVDRVNSKKIKGIHAEPVSIDKVIQGESSEYAVIIDRISQDVPFYRGMLKNAAVSGTAVINNPFWWSADEKFFNNALMTKVGVPVPKTVLLPSNQRPDDTTERSFRNLKFPFDWESIFNYIGFPAYMKPFAGGGWKSVYKVHNAEDFFVKHSETGQLVMMLQEEIVFEEYYRCYCIGSKYVKIMPYEPRNPHHLRYVADFTPSPERLKQMEEIVLTINKALGYDFNTVELALRDGVPYAIDFCNPAPDAEASSVGEENFEWVVEHAAKYAIERAQAHKEGVDNLTWGQFISKAVAGQPIAVQKTAATKTVAAKSPAKKAPAKTAAAKPAVKSASATTSKAQPTAKTATKPAPKTTVKKTTSTAVAQDKTQAKPATAKKPVNKK
jgi:glutathione synthase/RimK-type ligase-like ATP-grasp enzyme